MIKLGSYHKCLCIISLGFSLTTMDIIKDCVRVGVWESDAWSDLLEGNWQGVQKKYCRYGMTELESGDQIGSETVQPYVYHFFNLLHSQIPDQQNRDWPLRPISALTNYDPVNLSVSIIRNRKRIQDEQIQNRISKEYHGQNRFLRETPRSLHQKFLSYHKSMQKRTSSSRD